MRYLKKIFTIFVFMVIVVAIWRANNGDPTQVAQSIWVVLNHGADLLSGIAGGIFGMFKS